MTTFTLIATGETTSTLNEIESSVRDALQAVGVRLIPCNWAPDLDTISDATEVEDGELRLIDLN